MRKLLILLTCLCMALALGGTAMANGNPNDSTPKNSVASCALINQDYDADKDKCKDRPLVCSGAFEYVQGQSCKVTLCHTAKGKNWSITPVSVSATGPEGHENHALDIRVPEGSDRSACPADTDACPDEALNPGMQTENDVCIEDKCPDALNPGNQGSNDTCITDKCPDALNPGNQGPNDTCTTATNCPAGAYAIGGSCHVNICHSGNGKNYTFISPSINSVTNEHGHEGHVHDIILGVNATAADCVDKPDPVCPAGQTGTPPNCVTPPVTDTPVTNTPTTDTPVVDTPVTPPTTDTPDTPVTPVENEPEGPFTPGPVTDPVDGPETVVTPTNTVTPRGELPYTGNDDLLLVALLGLALAGAGIYLHRRGRDDDAA